MTTTTDPTPERTDWAGLPGDLLACVCELLSVPGRICFRAVCRSWRAADAVQNQRAAAMPPPWVIVPRTVGCSKSFTLLSIPTMQTFRWTPPGGAGLRCVGSSGGWLAGVYIGADRKVRIALLNPLTDARVEVPATTGRVVMPEHDHGEPGRRLQELALRDSVQKVAFSPSPTEQDFAVAVVTRSGKTVAFARAGCKGWCASAELPDDKDERGGYSAHQLDVAYHDGKFYYITRCRQVWVVDMAAPSPAPAPLTRFAPDVMPGFIGTRCCYHLAFTGDGALHVVWSTNHARSADALHMLAQRYDPSSSEGLSSPWAQATRLRGQAFLAGDLNQTLCVPAGGDGGAWLRPDSVYFTNTRLCSLLAEFRLRGGGHGGVWLFDLVAGDIGRPSYFRKRLGFRRPAWNRDDSAAEESLNCSKELGLDWSKAVWFMPSMR